MSLVFEWDENKARFNVRKHGVSFELAATVFGDPFALTIYDKNNSQNEDRYVTIGLSVIGLVVVVCHTDRANKIRIISARKATSKEKRQYEEGI
ncbi:MAG: BrnT family toxin [Deltaproteobacteria bacterium]|nr:BrnT family toxin [Deltaproteobacteria bacterium]